MLLLQIVVAVAILALIGFDGYTFKQNWSFDGTLSKLAWDFSKDWPVVPFVAGLALGWLFF